MRRMRTAILAAVIGVASAAQANAPVFATPAAASPTGALDVRFDETSARVNRDGSFDVAGFYTCHDPNPDRGVQLRIDLIAENNAEGGIDLSVRCGVAAAPWYATIPADADSPETFAAGVPTEARASLTLDGAAGVGATGEAILLAHNRVRAHQRPISGGATPRPT